MLDHLHQVRGRVSNEVSMPLSRVGVSKKQPVTSVDVCLKQTCFHY